MNNELPLVNEIEIVRRSVAMLAPGTPVLDRENTVVLLQRLGELDREITTLRGVLRGCLDELR